jgi:hypothetical protein
VLKLNYIPAIIYQWRQMTMINQLSTPISDSLLQQIRDYLDQEADILRLLDRATGGELLARRTGQIL